MSFEIYPPAQGGESERGYSAQDIRRGLHWVHTDVTCPHCAKEQPVAMTGYVGGPCISCGQPTLILPESANAH